MAQCAASWLITALPQLQFADDDTKLFTRSGNEHRSFIPSNCYPTRDGYVYLAIGNDSQWEKLTQIEGFAHLAKPARQTNAGRKADKDNIYADIRKGLQGYTTEAFIEACLQRNLAVAPVNTVRQVAALDYLQQHFVKTKLPAKAGAEREAPLFPAPMDTEFLRKKRHLLPCAPRLGEHNVAVFREAGLSEAEIGELREKGVI